MIKNIGKYAMLHMIAEWSPSIKFYKKNTNKNSEEQIDYSKYKSSKSSKYTKTRNTASITKLHNFQIKMKKAFITLNTIIEEMENEYSDLTNSDDDDEEKSHSSFRK